MTAESSDNEPSVKMLKCSHCTKTFRYNSERTRHEISHSPGFECEICSKKFSFVSALRRHHKQHERTGSVKCEECNRKFRDEVLLKRHVKYAHKGTFSCSKCSTTFSSDQALSTHMKTHRPVSERRYKCSFHDCGKSFNFPHHLKHHELTHTNAKQHYCSVCGKGFIQSHHLKCHLKTHDPAESLYCEFPGCKKKFSTEFARKRHMSIHKVKPDSGISSDSNSCDASVSSKDYAEDFILCASCGEKVHQSDVSKHSTICGDILDISTNIKTCTIDPIKEEYISDQAVLIVKRTFDIVPIKEENDVERVKITANDKDVGDCTSALGGCIMGANNCVCAQMSKAIDENYDFTPIGNSDNTTVRNNNIVESNDSIDFIDGYSEAVLNFFDNKENETVLKNTDLAREAIEVSKPTYVRSMCEGCDCASTCDIEPENCNGNKKNIAKNESNVHTVDGVLKIKDTFDIDIPMTVESVAQVNSDVNQVSSGFVPFSTCRDIIGNCIVGGNEGCLCARMMMDDQQGTAQEIDDITPVPKTEGYNT